MCAFCFHFPFLHFAPIILAPIYLFYFKQIYHHSCAIVRIDLISKQPQWHQQTDNKVDSTKRSKDPKWRLNHYFFDWIWFDFKFIARINNRSSNAAATMIATTSAIEAATAAPTTTTNPIIYIYMYRRVCSSLLLCTVHTLRWLCVWQIAVLCTLL